MSSIPKGTVVWTRDGLLPIENVTEGQQFQTWATQCSAAANIHHTSVTDMQSVTLDVYGCSTVTLPVSGAVWARKREDTHWAWLALDKVRMEDALWVPRIPEGSLSHIQGVLLSAELANVIGWYMSAGHIATDIVYFHLNAIEEEVVSTLVKDLRELQGQFVTPGYETRMSTPRIVPRGRHQQVSYANTKLATLLSEFGRSIRQRRMPMWLLDAPNAFVEQVLFAYLQGEGYYMSGWKVTATTAELARGLVLLLNKLGKCSSPMVRRGTRIDEWVIQFGWLRRRLQHHIATFTDHYECKVDSATNVRTSGDAYRVSVEAICVPYIVKVV